MSGVSAIACVLLSWLLRVMFRELGVILTRLKSDTRFFLFKRAESSPRFLPISHVKQASYTSTKL